MARRTSPHLFFTAAGVAWPVAEPTTFRSGGVLHAVDFADAAPVMGTRRKTRDTLCGKRIAPTPVTVAGAGRFPGDPDEIVDVGVPWPPPARNDFGTRCPACFAAGSQKRPDWTWDRWAPLLAAAAATLAGDRVAASPAAGTGSENDQEPKEPPR